MQIDDMLHCTAAQWTEHARNAGAGQTTALHNYRNVFRYGAADDRTRPTLRAVQHIETEADTVKFTLEHANNQCGETVIIPYHRAGRPTRTTLCVSSQLGCAMGCTFCQTAQLGLLKNLTARDIVEQWFVARHQFNRPIDNIVFMGMGEPMDNLDAVLHAIEILSDHNGAAIAASRITVSTVGRCAGIKRLAAFADQHGFRGLRLAVSINAPSDAVRSSIMPINRAEPMSKLRNAMLQWRDRVLIEYVLIPTVNMQPEHADQLAQYLEPLHCTVNLIPYNPRQDSPWPAPQDADIEAFSNRLTAHGLFVTRRRTTGRDVAAACGQLGLATPANAWRTNPRRHTPLSVTTAQSAAQL